MIKTLITLIRGRNFEAEERLADAHALTILDQQIRDATGDLQNVRRASAIAIAQDDAEARRCEGVRNRIADLEIRATAALQGGREDLALAAADAIAGLELELASAKAAQANFAKECAKLNAMASNAERRLAEFERGRRTARAAEAVRRLRSRGAESLGGGGSALQDAEATLARLRERQLADEAATQPLEPVESVNKVDRVSEKLEAAGFGDTTRPTAKSVLDRLRQRQQTNA